MEDGNLTEIFIRNIKCEVVPKLSEKKFHFFIQYCVHDTVKARKILTLLQNEGYRCTDDGDFTPGEFLIDCIFNAARNSEAVIFLLSDNFYKNQICIYSIYLVNYLNSSNEAEAVFLKLDNSKFQLDRRLCKGIIPWFTFKPNRELEKTGKLIYDPKYLLCTHSKSIAIYKNILKYETEKRYYIRLVVVGQDGVGKTCLIRRLLKQNINQVNSTEGIDITVHQCKVTATSNVWTFAEDNEEKRRNTRLYQRIVESPEYEELRKNVRHTKHPTKSLTSVISKAADFLKRGIASTKKEQERTTAVTDLKKLCSSDLPVDRSEKVHVSLWDFAGQVEYYPTHQLFLSRNCIVLLVTDISKPVKDVTSVRQNASHSVDIMENPLEDAAGYIQFWSSSVHCYGEANENQDGYLNPSIIPVATHTDKIEGNIENHIRGYAGQLCQAVGENIVRKHFRKLFTLSNTNDSDDTFERLRDYIISIAKKQDNWGIEVSLNWIPLENKLDELRGLGQPIMSYDKLKEVNEELLSPISSSKELHRFLKTQHDMGSCIFFDDIPEYIILSPQWFVNALKCIVGAKSFQLDHLQENWDRYENSGYLDIRMITVLFNEKDPNLAAHKTHILNVMEKYDIVVYAGVISDTGEELYCVPSMIRTSSLDRLPNKFTGYTNSPILCFEFDFLPPMFFCNVLVYFLRRYSVSKEELSNRHTDALYRGMAIFDVDNTGCEKIMLCKYKNVIQVQIWTWRNGKNDTGRMVRCQLEDDLFVIQRKYDVVRRWEVKLKCPEGSYINNDGMIDLNSLQPAREYFCKEHLILHNCIKYKNYWVQTLQKDNTISNEEFNFMRISKATVEVLTDVLYDLAKHSISTPLKPRNECDVTYLYQELRQNNNRNHVPSKGRWGGSTWPNEMTEQQIGDDLERIRINRNRLQHTAHYEMFDPEFNDRWGKLENLVKRFDVRLSPTTSYEEKLERIRRIKARESDFIYRQRKLSDTNTSTEYKQRRMGVCVVDCI